MSHIFGNDIDMFQDTTVISDALINIYELFALLLRMDSVKGFGVFINATDSNRSLIRAIIGA